MLAYTELFLDIISFLACYMYLFFLHNTVFLHTVYTLLTEKFCSDVCKFIFSKFEILEIVLMFSSIGLNLSFFWSKSSHLSCYISLNLIYLNFDIFLLVMVSNFILRG